MGSRSNEKDDRDWIEDFMRYMRYKDNECHLGYGKSDGKRSERKEP